MARLSVVGFSAELSQPLGAGMGPGTTLSLSDSGGASRVALVLNGPVLAECTGAAVNTVVLALSHPAGSEVIEVKAVGDALVVVERGLEGTQPISHPVGTCLRFSGSPDSPCDRAADICDSIPAAQSLAQCMYPRITERAIGDPILPRVLIDTICQSEELRDLLGKCVAPGVSSVISQDLHFVSELIDKLLEVITAEQYAGLADGLIVPLIRIICQNAERRAELASCIAVDVLNAIRDNAGARTLLQSLINTGMTGAAIASAICASNESVMALAQCIAGAILTAIENNGTWHVALRRLVLGAVDTSVGFTVNENYALGFNYNGALVVQSICNGQGQAQALAACLQPHLSSGGGGGGTGTGIGSNVEIGWICPPDDGLGGSQTALTLYARIPDSAANSSNISAMTVGTSSGSWTFNLADTWNAFDGSVVARFDSVTMGTGALSVLIARFTANGRTYSGMVTPNCRFGNFAGGA